MGAYRDCSFSCTLENAELVLEVLSRFPAVDAITSYVDGRVHYRIDLASVGKGDAPAIEAAIRAHLERCVSLHQIL